MKKLTITLYCLMTALSLFGGGKKVPTDSSNVEEEITQEQFTQYKNYFREESDLRKFICDFEQWPKEERQKIRISGLSFMIDSNIPQAQAYEDGNLGLWIDSRTQTQNQRVALIFALKYLQKQS